MVKDSSWKFYQFIRSERKRTYNQIADENRETKEEIKELKGSKERLERVINELRDEMKDMKEIEESVNLHKQRLNELVGSGLLNDNYNVIDHR